MKSLTNMPSAIEKEAIKFLRSPTKLKKLVESARQAGVTHITFGPLSLDLLTFSNPLVRANTLEELPKGQVVTMPMAMLPEEQEAKAKKEFEDLLFYSADRG